MRGANDTAGLDQLSGVQPFEDLTSAARAVSAVRVEDDEVTAPLLIRLLSTIQAAERRARAAEAESLIDPLTGLGNRRTWERLLAAEEARCARHGICACVVVIDLDGLKEVNDQRGHAAGDDLLVRAARTIAANTREHDVVVRLGGDEFGVLAPHCPHDRARLIGQRVVASLRAQGISASVGIACRDDGTLQEAWERADVEMYAAKRVGRSPR